MRSTRFPSRVAAAVLLGASFLSLPAVAQHASARPAVVAQAPAIERLTVRPPARLEPGRTIRFQLLGAPAATASVAIPGVARNIRLAETRRGVYEGSYTIRRRDDLSAFDRAVATLRRGSERATFQVALAPSDERAPRITQLTPGDGTRVDERGRTFIQARLSDNGTGVDPRSVRLVVDGLDVTANARITDDEVAYRERLGRGLHRAELGVRDRAGHLARSAWSFAVV